MNLKEIYEKYKHDLISVSCMIVGMYLLLNVIIIKEDAVGCIVFDGGGILYLIFGLILYFYGALTLLGFW